MRFISSLSQHPEVRKERFPKHLSPIGSTSQDIDEGWIFLEFTQAAGLHLETAPTKLQPPMPDLECVVNGRSTLFVTRRARLPVARSANFQSVLSGYLDPLQSETLLYHHHEYTVFRLGHILQYHHCDCHRRPFGRELRNLLARWRQSAQGQQESHLAGRVATIRLWSGAALCDNPVEESAG